MARFSLTEDAVLLPYVALACDWKAVMGQLDRRSLRGARQRLWRLRRDAGTLWRIERRAA